MVNEEKVRLMTQLAAYENREGKKYLPISRYYRSDFIGLALIKNFFLVSIAYVCMVALGVGYYFDYLLNNIHKMNLFVLGGWLILGYIVLLVFYSVLTYVLHSVKYYKAKKSLKQYYIQLSKLSRMYEKEERKSGQRTAGRRTKS